MAFTGRGGAGNILNSQTPSTTTSQAKAAISSDIEAQQQPTAESHTDLSARETQPYAHTGRGGAGNYYSPAALVQKGKFEGAGTSHVLGDGTPAPGDGDAIEGMSKLERTSTGGSVTAAYRGRGGAGNYAYGVTESEDRIARRKNEEEKERLRGMVEKGVEEGLARPERAKLPGGEPF